MMRTLIADFYREKAEQKVPFYIEMIGRHSVADVRPGLSLEPGMNFDGYSALVITGSQWMLASEDAPPATKDFVRALKIPTLGICFGHQLMARAHGAEVLSGELVERTERVLVSEPGALFAQLGPEVEMLESHREFVDYQGAERAGWHVIASSDSCPVEAMHHPTLPLFGVQFHPERSGPNGERLFDNFFTGIVLPYWRDRNGR
jgi:GMP synthase-like glutamine amidotransferase